MHIKNSIQPTKILVDSKQIRDLIQLGFSLLSIGKFSEAELIYEKVLSIQPNNFDALQLMGAIAVQLKKYQQAIKFLTKAVRVNPYHPDAHSNLSNAFSKLNKFNDALHSANKAISLKSNFPEAFVNRGNALKELKRFDEALLSYDQAISLKSDYVDAHNNRGNALKELKRFDEALLSYDQAISLKSDYMDAHNNRGYLLFHEFKNFEEALDSFNKAISINGNNATNYNNRGNTLYMLKRYDEAIASYDQAIKLKLDYADAYNNLGNTLLICKHFDLALASYEVAINIKSDFVHAYSNRGNALKELKRYDEALVSFDKAIGLKTDFVDAHSNQASVYREIGRHDEALVAYEKIVSLKLNSIYALGCLLEEKLALSDWKDWDFHFQRLLKNIAKDKNAALPFSGLLLFDDPKTHRELSEAFVKQRFGDRIIFDEFSKNADNRKIRLGFYSPDLHSHPVSIHLAPLLECIDKSKFELFAFSFTSHIKDPMRTRYEDVFDRFIEVDKISDFEVVKLSHELGIDIAFDLCGHTGANRGEIFVNRAAPIQVNYIGYPGTSGSEWIDYLFCSAPGIPESTRNFYSEKIVYLPCAVTYDTKRKVSSVPLSRAQFGLPDDSFVFVCQNGNQKINPEVFSIWMEILCATPKSVLWLQKPNPTAMKNLIREAGMRGVAEDRLIFTQRETVSIDRENDRISRYLASYQLADLFLDTWPYGAGTTALDAVYSGLPVLTKYGKSAVSRMATALFTGIIDQNLITASPEEYRSTAIELAMNSQKLQSIKENLSVNKFNAPLFNPQLFVKYFESACTQIYERYQADLPPDHIEIT
jgi:predicted O-linked N-acetylglucosamine transferase (SPINDLY family)